MKNKKLIRWLCLLLIVTVAGAAALFTAPKAEAAPAGLVLEDMPIVLPANATDVEKSAAKELQHYLREMTGSASSMITESVPMDSAIYIGATEFARLNNVTYTNNNGMGEGWAIKAVGENLVLTGGETRGTLYAVYHLLEDEFGVRWWNFWEEYVPIMDDAVLPFGFERSGEPVFADRGIYSVDGVNNLFYARNRLNGFSCNPTEAFGGELSYGLPYHVHTFNRYFPAFSSGDGGDWNKTINPEGVSWFLEHPEWFAWSDARQEYISFGQMCLTNEELMKVFAEKVIAAIELSYKQADAAGVARPRYMDISPNDLPYHCECDRCDEVLAASGPSGRLFKFINYIAEEVEKVYPEMLIETLAYAEYFEVPLDDTKPRHNVVIRLASSDVDVMHDLDHSTNKQVKTRLEKYGELLEPGQLMYWDYGVYYSDNGVVPNYFKWFGDYQKFHQAGGSGIFMELEELGVSDFWDFKHWVLCKLMEDPYRDQYELSMEFLNGYYGEAAADYLYDYMVFMEEQADAYKTRREFAEKVIDAPWLSAKDVLKGHQFFEDAAAALEADSSLTEAQLELYRNRLNMARMGLDRQTLYNYSKYVAEIAALNDPNAIFSVSKQEAAARLTACQDWQENTKPTEDYSGVNQFGVRADHEPKNTAGSYYDQYTNEYDEKKAEYIERPEIPEQIYEDHPGLSKDHIYDFTANGYFNANIYVSTPYTYQAPYASSWGGTAAVYDYEKLYNFEQQYGGNSLGTYTFSESKPLKIGVTGDALYLGDPVVADGEYHLYRMEDVLLPNSETFAFFGEEIRFTMKGMEHLANVPVDVYISMKVVGDPSGENLKNLGKVYIERVLIVEPCDAYHINYTEFTDATCKNNATKSGKCPVCGEKFTTEISGSKTKHTLTGNYVYDAASNTYRANCAVCGELEYQFLAELPENVLEDLAAAHIELDNVHDYGVDDFTQLPDVVNDPDSKLGKAAFYSLGEMESVYYFRITKDLPLWIWEDKVPDNLYADEIITDGEYHTYRLKDVSLIKENDSKLIFFDWTLQADFSKLNYLLGRKVDVYLSFKVDGELDFYSGEDYPDYYIDRIIVVETCPDHRTESYSFNGETGLYEGQCVSCGVTISYGFAGDLPQVVKDDLAATGTGLQHVYEYTADDFSVEPGFPVVEDPESAVGEAFKVDAWNCGLNPGLFILYPYEDFNVGFDNDETAVGELTYSMLKSNENKGYQIYKFEDGIMPAGARYFTTFEWYMMCFPMISELNHLQGKPLDFYISMKVEGKLDNDATETGGPIYYLDRIIVVDSCDNHMTDKQLVSAATCYKGAVYRGTCSFCGAVIETENESTKLSHNFGAYEISADGLTQTAKCKNKGCTEKKIISFAGELPQIVKDDLAASGTSYEHVYEYTANDFSADKNFPIVSDPESAVGKAQKFDAWNCGLNPGLFILYSYEDFNIGFDNNDKALGELTYSMLKPNENKRYQIYKFEDVLIPSGARYFTTFEWHMLCFPLVEDLEHLQGKPLDFYISLKIKGKIDNDLTETGGPTYYLDRIIVVDSCDNYEFVYKEEGTASCTSSTTLVAHCPVCGSERTKPGTTTANHKFTKYYRIDKSDKMTYVAECDYGCGATDTKLDQKLTLQEKLPADLPESVRKHVIWSYSCDEFTLGGLPQNYQWDMALDRPVGVRGYAWVDSDIERSALLLNASGGINFSMYPSGREHYNVGSFKGSEIVPNAGDGQYHLYSINNVIPVTDGSYNYCYMFIDWVFQISMLDDDLIRLGYRNKPVDIYMNLKVEGDPTGANRNDPVRYYIDQIIIATSCKTDKTWTVTREPTCIEPGEMVGDCEICGLKGTSVSIPVIDHEVKYGLRTQTESCRANRIEYGQCSMCGERVSQEIAGTKLEHSFTNYVKQDDGKEAATCDNGCGERHVRDSFNTGDNLQISEQLQQILPVFGAGGRQFSFSDVKETDWYFSNVKEAWENKLIDGVTATEFRPNETLTVAQAVKLAAAYHERYNTGDVSLTNGSGNWYSSYVDYAIENGIVDSKYADYDAAKMNKAISRSEFVAIFESAMDEEELVGYNTVSDNAIPDVKADDTNADAIYTFYRAGILTGSDAKGTFNPKSNIKRSEVATILSRMYNENVRQAITLN